MESYGYRQSGFQDTLGHTDGAAIFLAVSLWAFGTIQW